jgi:hypothetical protein
VQFWDKFLVQLAALPGVVSAAAADGVPLGGTYDGNSVEVEGQNPARDWAEATTRDSTVRAGYFRTVGIPLWAGRAFTASDTGGAEPVTIRGIGGIGGSAHAWNRSYMACGPRDPAVIAAAAVALAALALLAVIQPAGRAASVEPMAALRQE